jgi:hypothetical protein
MKITTTFTKLLPKKWLAHGLVIVASMLLMTTYSPQTSAGITDFVADELAGCKIYNFPDPTAKVKWQGACVDGKISGGGMLMTNHIEKQVICKSIVLGSKAGLLHGFVKSTCSNGVGLEGEYVEGLPSGIGKLIKPDGEKIELEYKYGVLIRQGTQMVDITPQNKIQGVYQNGQHNGQSVQTLPDGEKRVGEFKDGEIIRGIAYYPNKEKYEGEFKNGMPHGKGKLTYMPVFGSTYEGDFANGVPHGTGKHTWQYGSAYKGEFANGKFHGHGVLNDPDGDYQIGVFKEGGYVSGSGPERDTLDARKRAARDRELERKYNIRIIRID